MKFTYKDSLKFRMINKNLQDKIEFLNLIIILKSIKGMLKEKINENFMQL